MFALPEETIVPLAIAAVVATFGIAWVVSERSARPNTRCFLGLLALLSALGLAGYTATAYRRDYDRNSARATKVLIDESIKQLAEGETESVLASWRELRRQLIDREPKLRRTAVMAAATKMRGEAGSSR